MRDLQRSIIAYAFVSDALRETDDLVTGLMPLFAPIAQDLANEQFSPLKLCTELRERYGLIVPTEAASYMESRLVRAGFLARRTVGSHDATFFWKWVDDKRQNRPDLENICDRLLSAFRKYCDEKRDLFNKTFSDDEFFDSIFDYFLQDEKELQKARELLESNEDGQAIWQRSVTFNESVYVASQFLRWLEIEDEELFQDSAEVANAVIVSEVVLEFQEPSFSKDKASDLTIFLDTPICLNILGCSGGAQEDSAKYIVECFQKLGVKTWVFQHSIEEMSYILEKILSTDPSERYGPTKAALSRGETSIEYLRSVRRDPERFLEEMGIRVLDLDRTGTPANQLKYFDREMVSDLTSNLNQRIAYRNVDSLVPAERDALSAAVVMRRRQGVRQRDLFRSKFAVLTDNKAVEAVSHAFCVNNGMISKHHLGPFIDTSRAAAIVWLTSGNAGRKELSRRQLVLNCAKPLQNSPDVVEILRARIAESSAEKADRFSAMVTEPRMLQMALDFSYASIDRARTIDSPLDLYNKMEEERAREVRETVDRERSEANKKMRAKQKEVEEANSRAKLSEQAVDAGFLAFIEDLNKIASIWCQRQQFILKSVKIIVTIIASVGFISALIGFSSIFARIGSGVLALLTVFGIWIDPRDWLERRSIIWRDSKFQGELSQFSRYDLYKEKLEVVSTAAKVCVERKQIANEGELSF